MNVSTDKIIRIQQGDIISDVEYIEYADVEDGVVKISKIRFPHVIVLSQECDLTWDYESRDRQRKNQQEGNQDKFLFTVIVAPLYNYQQFLNGEHLSELGLTMRKLPSQKKKTENKYLRNNEIPRYHFLDFPNDVSIVDSVVDFKHYFTVNITRLEVHKETHFVCSLPTLFRERIAQRFANYLTRIGLPDVKQPDDLSATQS